MISLLSLNEQVNSHAFLSVITDKRMNGLIYSTNSRLRSINEQFMSSKNFGSNISQILSQKNQPER